MNRILVLLSVLFAYAVVNVHESRGQDANAIEQRPAAQKRGREQPMSVWMERKLQYSQTIFKALTMGDLEAVNFNARQMNLIGKVEGFARKKNKSYMAQHDTFDRISFELSKQAELGNIEGATLAFNQLTVNCVQCHKLLRVDDSNKTIEN